MANRPQHINLPARIFVSEKQDIRTPSPRDLFPPKSGDVPPALSPLDAFALQSRMLAQKLEQGAKSDKRISRLPQFYVAKELSKPRPGYSERERRRSREHTRKHSKSTPARDGDSGINPTVTKAAIRPKSQYPQLETIPVADHDDASSTYSDSSVYSDREDDDDDEEMPDEARLALAQDYFQVWQSSGRDIMPASPVNANRSPVLQPSPQRTPNAFLTTSPRSPAVSISRMTVRTVSNGSPPTRIPQSPLSDLRKASGSTAESQSPSSPSFTVPRSPSISSDHSGGASLPPPNLSVNFSRPLSSKFSPRPSFDTRPSFESSTKQINADDDDERNLTTDVCFSPVELQQPLSPTSSNPYSAMSPTIMLPEDDNPPGQPVQQRPLLPSPAPSYIYAKYSLPRGRIVSKGATQLPDSTVHRFEFEEAIPIVLSPNRVELTEPTWSPSDEGKNSTRVAPPSPTPTPKQSRPQLRLETSTKPPSTLSMTPEQHLQVGISAHEAGQLPKSTYHLRLAARAGLPTAMLLYALACRHGWGMRTNQAEAVTWLRKAIDCAGLELASSGTTPSANAASGESSESLQALLAHKAHTASLALAIYELGQCYMNGWGVPSDRSAGLRSFEIAGAMGDRDAVAEAAFCYAKGVGCKKNLQKSAELYRKAEAMGVEVVGESWFRKEKYGGGEKQEGGEKEREKSRGLFGRKKDKEREL